jgi:hypothetical protein
VSEDALKICIGPILVYFTLFSIVHALFEAGADNDGIVTGGVVDISG